MLVVRGPTQGETRVTNHSRYCDSWFGWNPSPPDGGPGPSWNSVPRHSRVSNLVRKFDKVFWGRKDMSANWETTLPGSEFILRVSFLLPGCLRGQWVSFPPVGVTTGIPSWLGLQAFATRPSYSLCILMHVMFPSQVVSPNNPFLG